MDAKFLNLKSLANFNSIFVQKYMDEFQKSGLAAIDTKRSIQISFYCEISDHVSPVASGPKAQMDRAAKRSQSYFV